MLRAPEVLKVVWLPHSPNPAFAGVRLRCLMPCGLLRDRGISARIALEPEGTAPDLAVVQAKWLLDTADPTALRARMDRLRRWRDAGTALALDSFDNYFVNESGGIARARLLDAYRDVLPDFAAFVVSSPGLAPLLAAEIPPTAKVRIVGDPIELPGAERCYEPLLRRISPTRWQGHLRATLQRIGVRRAARDAHQLIWFGNHGSRYATGGIAELQRIVPQLEAAYRQVPLQLTVVSNSRERYEETMRGASIPHAYVEWDRLHFARLLAAHDLALIPASITPFTVAKSNNRLLLPLALGVPVAADGIPDYLPWRDHFALSPWARLPEVLADLPGLRQLALAAAGPIASGHALQRVADAWQRAFESILADAQPRRMPPKAVHSGT